MRPYAQLIKDAYHITLQHPVLWLFGLFVFGGMNLNFLYFGEARLGGLLSQFSVAGLAERFSQDSGSTIIFILALLAVVLVGLVLASWSRVLLVLSVKSVLDDKTLYLQRQLKKSTRVLWPVVVISILTTGLLALAVAGLLAPPLLWVADTQSQLMLWTLALIIFFGFSFTISAINVFAGFFIILFEQKAGRGLNLGTDFFVSKWTEILGISLVLLVVYAVVFLLGLAAIYLLQAIAFYTIAFLAQLGISGFSAMIVVVQWFGVVLLWVLIGGLNVFFNTVLLLFFLEHITPIKGDEPLEKAVISPVPSL